jgi:hypothetical protein
MGRGFIGQALRQVWNRLTIRDKAGRVNLAKKPYHSATAARAAENAATVNFFNTDQIGTLYYTVLGLNLAERAGPEAIEEVARIYANHAIIAGILSLHGPARTYVRLAEERVRDIDNPITIALIQQAIATYEFSLAKWDSVLERIDTTIDLTQKAGDKRNWEVAMLSKGIALHMLGRWPDAIELCKQYLVSAEERGDNETQSRPSRAPWARLTERPGRSPRCWLPCGVPDSPALAVTTPCRWCDVPDGDLLS